MFGFTRSPLLGFVICFGKVCYCTKIYYGSATKRFGGWCYKMSAKDVFSTTCGNHNFKFFGFIYIPRNVLYDLID